MAIKKENPECHAATPGWSLEEELWIYLRGIEVIDLVLVRSSICQEVDPGFKSLLAFLLAFLHAGLKGPPFNPALVRAGLFGCEALLPR